MSRDYKRTDRPHGGRRNGSSLLVGILIGLVLGLCVALAVAWYINKMPSPFASRVAPPAKNDVPKALPPQGTRTDEPKAKSEEKARFDFYKILPGAEEPKSEKQPRETPQASPPAGREAFMLQAGAFQNAADADNLKARLALLGFEATIETSAVADKKGTWHRVRVGPYTSVAELNRTRDTLNQNGVPTTLIKLREPER
jgi:cell division protein FtsN